jgi:hypothetical protein
MSDAATATCHDDVVKTATLGNDVAATATCHDDVAATAATFGDDVDASAQCIFCRKSVKSSKEDFLQHLGKSLFITLLYTLKLLFVYSCDGFTFLIKF